MAVPLAAVAVLAAAGCSSVKGTSNANLIAGKVQFVSKCGACHTLARADTKGTVGPNLDVAFAQSLKEGLGRNAIRSVVEYQIAHPNPTGAMPKDLVGGQASRNVSAYVERSADAPGPDTGLLATAVEAPGAGKPAVESGGKLAIDANPTGQLAYASSKALATAGAVTVTMANMSGVMHNIAFEAGENGATAKGPVIAHSSFISKGTTSVKLTLKPGKYTFFCEVPGHRQAGMYGTLTVK
ncbi:MAG TPA: plastocyanin/azurin family copper-binding protein [Solirubrobacteraceae bacterium]|nr:plastocyanin/azurin family copper-binding protein [Solirubrobacteraceae bacterium]